MNTLPTTAPVAFIRAAVSAQTVISDSTIINEISSYINKYRSMHNSPPLIWDNTIASFSQKWSNYLFSNNMFAHSGSHIYGENLAYFKGYGTDVLTLIKLAIDMWYDEINLYDFNNPGFSEETGHATALLWKSSTKYAIGFSINKTTQTAYVVFNTSPPGNIIGQFKENVLPITSNTTNNTNCPPCPKPEVLKSQQSSPTKCDKCLDWHWGHWGYWGHHWDDCWSSSSGSDSWDDRDIKLKTKACCQSKCSYDKLNIVKSLYVILNDLVSNKKKSEVVSELKVLINDIGTIE